MVAADAPDQDDAPATDATQPDAGDALPAGPSRQAVPASSVAAPAAAQIPASPIPGAQFRSSASDIDPAGQSQRLSSGPDPLVWTIYHAKPQMIPRGYVVDPGTGAVSRWNLTPRGDPLRPAVPELKPLDPADKQRFLERITGASESGFGAVSPQERFQRSTLEQGLTPGVPDWAKLRAPDAQERGLLDFIAGKEGADDATARRNNFASGYDVTYDNVPTPKPLTQTSLGDVARLQQDLYRNSGATAVGRYQFTKGTLDRLKASSRLSDSDLFTPELQDRLGRQLLKEKGLEDYRDGKISPEQFQNNLAGTWASIPVYGVGLNRGKKTRASDSEVQMAVRPLGAN
jgi:muramidase (phage lysozyme)